MFNGLEIGPDLSRGSNVVTVHSFVVFKGNFYDTVFFIFWDLNYRLGLMFYLGSPLNTHVFRMRIIRRTHWMDYLQMNSYSVFGLDLHPLPLRPGSLNRAPIYRLSHRRDPRRPKVVYSKWNGFQKVNPSRTRLLKKIFTISRCRGI